MMAFCHRIDANGDRRIAFMTKGIVLLAEPGHDRGVQAKRNSARYDHRDGSKAQP
jgi:hypothetical protein